MLYIVQGFILIIIIKTTQQLSQVFKYVYNYNYKIHSRHRVGIVRLRTRATDFSLVF
jgi:hypothetical protein